MRRGAVLLIVVYVIGMPMLFLFLMNRAVSQKRETLALKQTNHDPDNKETKHVKRSDKYVRYSQSFQAGQSLLIYVTGFLWRSSKQDKWWWQFTVLLRQLLLSMVLVLPPLNDPFIPLGVLCVLVGNLTVLGHHWPHRVDWDNRLEAAMLALGATDYICVCLQNTIEFQNSSLVAYMYVASNYTAFTLIFIALFVRTKLIIQQICARKGDSNLEDDKSEVVEEYVEPSMSLAALISERGEGGVESEMIYEEDYNVKQVN